MKKNLKYYLSLKYPLEIRPMEHSEGGYYAVYPDFGGTTAHGDGKTIAAAIKEADISKELTIESLLARGEVVPEPATSYSGKFILRTPKSLHRDLALRAEREGVSLNQFAVATLIKGLR
jgi:antitoxin HicB